MEEADKKKLDKHFPEIVERVNPQQVLPFLRCLSIYSKEEIATCQTSYARYLAAYKLHEHLIKKPKGFEEFVAALRHPTIDLGDLADKLDPPVTHGRTIVTEAAAVSSSSYSDNSTGACAQTGLVRRSASQTSCTLETPWPQLPARVRTVLKKADQSQTPEDLAGILDFTVDEFNQIKHDVLPGVSLTLAIIEHWNQNVQIKLRDIMDKFHELNRIDILRDLEKATGVKFTTPTDGEGASSGAEIDPAQNVTQVFIHQRDQSRRSQVRVSQEETPTLQRPVEDVMQVNHNSGQSQFKLSSNRSKVLEQSVICTNRNSYDIVNSETCKMEDSSQSLEADCAKPNYFQGYTAQEIVGNNSGDASNVSKTEPSSATTSPQGQPVDAAIITELTRNAEFNNLDEESSESNNEISLDSCPPDKDDQINQSHEAPESKSASDSLVKEHITDEKAEENKLPDNNLAGMNNVNQPFSVRQNESFFATSQSTRLEQADCPPNVICGTDKLLQDFKQRNFEEKLVNANPSSILMSTPSSLSDKVSTVGQVSRELCLPDGGENYSLEDAKAEEPKVPSMSRELLSIERKKKKPLPFSTPCTEGLSFGSYLPSFGFMTNDLVTDGQTALPHSEMDNMMQPELPHSEMDNMMQPELPHSEMDNVMQPELPHEIGGLIDQENEENVRGNDAEKKNPDQCLSKLASGSLQAGQDERYFRGPQAGHNEQSDRDLRGNQSEQSDRDLRGNQSEQSSNDQLGDESDQADRGLQDSQIELSSRGQLSSSSPHSGQSDHSDRGPLDDKSTRTAYRLLDSLRGISRHDIFTAFKISYDSFI